MSQTFGIFKHGPLCVHCKQLFDCCQALKLVAMSHQLTPSHWLKVLLLQNFIKLLGDKWGWLNCLRRKPHRSSISLMWLRIILKTGIGLAKWGTISKYQHRYANLFSNTQRASTASNLSLLYITSYSSSCNNYASQYISSIKILHSALHLSLDNLSRLKGSYCQ